MGPDFSKYDAATLRQVLGTINAARFPERAEEIHARLARLEREAPLTPAMAAAPDHLEDVQILRRAGAVLIAFGLLDFAMKNGLIAHAGVLVDMGALFIVLPGVLLLRGGMRTASFVRWLAWVLLTVELLLAIPFWTIQTPLDVFVTPLDLMMTQWRLSPVPSLISTVVATGYCLLPFWLARQLGRAPVLAARVAAARPLRDMRIPCALGVVVAIGIGMLAENLLGGGRAGRAEAMVAAKLGSGYRYHTSAIGVTSGGGVTAVNAWVVAWNAGTVRNVPVHWQE